MKKPQIILGLFHLIIVKLGFMKKLYINLIVCQLVTVTIYLQATHKKFIYKNQDVACQTELKKVTFSPMAKIYFCDIFSIEDYKIPLDELVLYREKIRLDKRIILYAKNNTQTCEQAVQDCLEKGIKYDALEKDYKKIESDFEYYQGIIIASGSSIAIAIGYTLYEWFKHKGVDQCP